MDSSYDYMTEQLWNSIVQAAAEQYDDLALKRGFQYFKQGKVQREYAPGEGAQIRAIVHGNEDYSVEIRLDALHKSSCSCPVPGPCMHMAALLIDIADQYNAPLHELVNARSMMKMKNRTSAKLSLVRKSEEQQAIEQEALRIPTMTVQEWQNWFQRAVQPYESMHRNPQYASSSLSAVLDPKPALSPVTEMLYQMHARLFVLSKLMNPYRSTDHHFGSYLPYNTDLAASELQKSIIDYFDHPLPLDKEPEEWERVKQSLDCLRIGMLKERPKDRLCFGPCYYELWASWISPHLDDDFSLLREELELLAQAQDDLGETLQRTPWLLARARMHFYLGEDREAWVLLRQVSALDGYLTYELLYYPAELEHHEEWERMVGWLKVIGPLLGSRTQGVFDNYFGFWESAAKQLPEAEEQMWDILIGMLPGTRRMYEQKLIEYGKWQEWMDCQLSMGSDPLEFRVSELQPIEKEAPELLLPFYHQAIERYILQKNRHGYKQAVKLLKRTSKLYKRLKREERWELFLASFTFRHSRLRALQEELRRGKLIP
ncbi:SWIM zinc finger family protein [Cohnella fermenti]|uniref:SWIM-type domain-containing protein n=1 Tax=Cohnella fermenti TaxID=2565925 RepID=A0A4S4C965_9BACL|nr:hypothetical protein [Cohnella fermenti]THF84600.1 hypothetical protein E6C55_01045 [Cohnella fermenti]